jgi:GT2 family glycosyltransferase
MARYTQESNELVFLLTTFNRISLTLRCLSSIESQVPNFLAVVVDDASEDYTPEYIREYFPTVRVLSTGGNHYWAAGMKLAQDLALETFLGLEKIFLLNDDVILSPDTVYRMLELSRRYPDSVIVGSVVDPKTSFVTYGGLRKNGIHPLAVQVIEIVSDATEVELFHGNLLLIPKEVLLRVGGIDGSYQHAYADFDLALRLREIGVKAYLLPGVAGYCSPNLLHVSQPSLIARIRFSFSPKGRPLKSQFRYMKRHGPPIYWIIFVISPYFRVLLDEVNHAFGIRRRKN